MIKLDVRYYCHECPIFSPYIKSAPQRVNGDFGEMILGENCVVGCLREKECRWVEEKVLERVRKEGSDD